MKVEVYFCDCCEKEMEDVNELTFTLEAGDKAGTVIKELCNDCYWKLYYAQSDKYYELRAINKQI